MNALMKCLQTTHEIGPSLALLALRLWFGGVMFLAHGFGKLGRDPGAFPDLLGIGPTANWALCVAAEVGCSALLVFGIATRVVSLPLIITMLMAAFVAHGDDPFGKKELALCYCAGYVALLCAGGGRFSLDHLITARSRRPVDLPPEPQQD